MLIENQNHSEYQQLDPSGSWILSNPIDLRGIAQQKKSIKRAQLLSGLVFECLFWGPKGVDSNMTESSSLACITDPQMQIYADTKLSGNLKRCSQDRLAFRILPLPRMYMIPEYINFPVDMKGSFISVPIKSLLSHANPLFLLCGRKSFQQSQDKINKYKISVFHCTRKW